MANELSELSDLSLAYPAITQHGAEYSLADVKAIYLAVAKRHPSGGWAVYDPDTGEVRACAPFKFPHSFDGGKTWIEATELSEPLYRSVGGGFYMEADLPEQGDEFCTQQFERDMRSERNARISDTDSYVQLSDVTVQKVTKAKRAALTDEEKAEVLKYRTALRDLPEIEGWPFVDFPAIPSCIAVEAQEKIKQRVSERQRMMEAK